MNGPGNLSERFVAALEEAFRIHQLDLRKGTTIPYIRHLMAVTTLVLSGGDEDEAIVALLHDAADDHGDEPRLAVIADRFGRRVATLGGPRHRRCASLPRHFQFDVTDDGRMVKLRSRARGVAAA